MNERINKGCILKNYFLIIVEALQLSYVQKYANQKYVKIIRLIFQGWGLSSWNQVTSGFRAYLMLLKIEIVICWKELMILGLYSQIEASTGRIPEVSTAFPHHPISLLRSLLVQAFIDPHFIGKIMFGDEVFGW